MDLNLLNKPVIANYGAMHGSCSGSIVVVDIDNLSFSVLWENDTLESFHVLQLKYGAFNGIGIYLANSLKEKTTDETN